MQTGILAARIMQPNTNNVVQKYFEKSFSDNKNKIPENPFYRAVTQNSHKIARNFQVFYLSS